MNDRSISASVSLVTYLEPRTPLHLPLPPLISSPRLAASALALYLWFVQDHYAEPYPTHIQIRVMSAPAFP